jgi:hypothetical protein
MSNLDLYKFRDSNVDATAIIRFANSNSTMVNHQTYRMAMWNALDMHIWTLMLSITNNKWIDWFTLTNTTILLMNIDDHINIITESCNHANYTSNEW